MLAQQTEPNVSLSCGQLNLFQQLGYLILENFIPDLICDLLIERATQLIANADLTQHKVLFSTTTKSHQQADYFLTSGDKIRFFYEPKALTHDGNLTTEKQLAINKIGHALHDLDPVFYCFSRQYKIAKLIESLKIANPLLVQSMYICKQPFIGDEVTCHQDSTFIYTQRQPVIGLWFAMEDATLENGCLWAIPGAHQDELKSRFIRNDHQVRTEIYDDTPWPTERLVPLAVKRGTLIVLHGLLPHMSQANTSSKSRHAYTLHIIDKDAHYAPDNWLQRDAHFPFTGF